MNDAIGNQVPLAIGSVFLVNPHVKSGKLRAIAVTSAKPDPSLPGVAPIASQGVPGFEAYTWWGVFGPGNMPPALAKRIYEELAKAAKTPAVAEKLSAQGIDVTARRAGGARRVRAQGRSRAGPRSSRTTTSRAATEGRTGAAAISVRSDCGATISAACASSRSRACRRRTSGCRCCASGRARPCPCSFRRTPACLSHSGRPSECACGVLPGS